MGGTKFKLDLNLRNLSMISIAAELWDSQDIKSRIKNNFSGRDRKYPDENWYEISKLVVQYANSIHLPASLKVLLKNTILLFGQKMYNWILYVTNILGLDSIFTQKIYFSLGLVDEVKIFDLYWKDLMAPDNFLYQSDYFKHSPLFSLACIYGCEKLVMERKNEMLDELSEFYPQIKEGDEIYNIMSVSICMTEQVNIYENVASPQRMFELCLKAGFSKAARFYWGKLDKVEKVSNLTNFAKKCWREDYDVSFVMEKRCENLLFLINQMGEEERHVFFTDYADEIIRLFLPVWPYQELIVDLLKYDWNIESSRLRRMADFLISFCQNMNRLEFPLCNKLVFKIMQKAWGSIPVDEKLHCFRKNEKRIICGLFSTLNPEILNLVLNDPTITEVDSIYLQSFIKKGFLQLAKMGKFDFLNSIIETVFNFIPEPKEFLKDNFSNYNFFLELMENDGLVDRFLDWSAESEAERARLKNKINTISVCRYLTEECKNFELADKFLKWNLETDANIKKFKEEMKSFSFVIVEFSRYVRIKSGDLSWLRPGDSLAMHPDDDPFDNADGLTFLKLEDATELDRGVVLGVKSFCEDMDDDFLGPDGCHATRWFVDYVGTKVADFIVFTVRKIFNRVDYLSLKFDDFAYHRLYSIASILSNALIKFYYETDEEVLNFKKTLFTENMIEFLRDALYAYGDVLETFLDDFCEFCMIPSDKIEEIKIQQLSEIEKFLNTCLIDERNFDLVDCYLNWLVGEVKKTEVCKKYLNSSNKGALLCDSFLKRRGNDSPFHNGSLPKICRWLSLVDDIEKLKNDVFAINENTPDWFPSLLSMSAQYYFLWDI